eukprot:TRINITY_DN50170_c0_g1_i1.p1 TRINITY_DN50170_c0_g1~~TRINITY_DN50170_c0_g1_i1.p1  ORF type:complete len:164 (-),score=33.65 TRINITY_DN50170_c0_g1_i1:91-582(-)
MLGTKIQTLKKQFAADVLVIADLNLDMPLELKQVENPEKQQMMPELFSLEPTMSSEDVWRGMNIEGSPDLKTKTEYYLSCCSDKDKKKPDGTLYPPGGKIKFHLAFDRILADFGQHMETIRPLDTQNLEGLGMCRSDTDLERQNTCPMYVGAFHKPIIGIITL